MPIFEKATVDDGGKESRAATQRSIERHRTEFLKADGCMTCGSRSKATTFSVAGVILVECQKCADKRG
jgi:hypothetical protein